MSAADEGFRKASVAYQHALDSGRPDLARLHEAEMRAYAEIVEIERGEERAHNAAMSMWRDFGGEA